MSLQLGEEIAGCRIVGKLGEGGMGEVYLAHQVLLDRQVAVKILRSGETREEAIRRFEREMRVHMKLSHPNLVKVYDAGQERGLRFIVLELVDGNTLRRVLRTGKRFSWAAASTGMKQILEALVYLAAARVVHRDLKPENVLIDRQGIFKVVDFGLVKPETGTVLTAANQVVGSVQYLAPEVLMGSAPDGKVDVYAAGLIFFELLTGRLPYKGKDPQDWLRVIVQEPPAPVRDFRQDLGGLQEEFVARLLEKDPANRPTAAEAVQLLETATTPATPPVPEPPRPRSTGVRRSHATPATPAGSQAGRCRPIAAAGVVLLGAALAVLIGHRAMTGPGPAAVASSGSPISRHPETGWIQSVPDPLPGGIPVIAWWDGTPHRSWRPLSPEQWKEVFEHNAKLDDGERADVWLALAVQHGRGLGVPRDLMKAKHLLKKAARAGNGFAMIALGWDPKFYLDSSGKLLDHAGYEELVRRWLEGRTGIPPALTELGILLQRRGKISEAMSCFEKAADLGEGVACRMMGIRLEQQDGSQDPTLHTRAREWYRRGIESGDPASAHCLASLLFRGLGGPRDLARAYELNVRSAEAGEAWGALRAGEACLAGHGVPVDPEKADHWFKTAISLCELKPFEDRPESAPLEDQLAIRGYKVGREPKDDVQLMRGAVGI